MKEILAVANLRVTGRATQGVKLINLRKNDSIAAVAQVAKVEDEETVINEDVNNIAEGNKTLDDVKE